MLPSAAQETEQAHHCVVYIQKHPTPNSHPRLQVCSSLEDLGS